MSKSTSNTIPAIRTFQFGSLKEGAIRKSVNMFRGDINFHQKLISLPDRPGQHDLEVNVSLMLKSNIQDEVMRRNLESPTGILGVGWSMALEKIIAIGNHTASKTSQTYYYEKEGIRNRLYKSDFKTQVDKEYYQLQNYEFWDIWYTPSLEKWEIIQENGVTNIYGGGVDQTSNGYNISTGNSIVWGVAWGNWVGTSSLTNGQRQYASQWYLCESMNNWGDSISYEYNGFERQNGLISNVEQLVGGTSGKPYTKAIYVTKITDIFGRTVNFSYGDKSYNGNIATNSREYVDPHKLDPNTSPNAYQDRYETKYLEKIFVNNEHQESLFSIQFEYYPLKNLTTTTDALKGETYKRYLKSITQMNSSGEQLPGFLFDYNWDTEVNLGAISKMTYPTGGVVTYTYSDQELTKCVRNIQMVSPSEAHTPRAWFGTDYTIIAWYNQVDNTVRLTVYTWLGYWHKWEPNNSTIFNNGSIKKDSLNVISTDNHFGIYANDTDKTTIVLFNKNHRQSGEWMESSHIVFPSNKVDFSAGDLFLTANVYDPNTVTYSLNRMTWLYQKDKWNIEKDIITVKDKVLKVTATREYYAIIESDKSANQTKIKISYVNELGDWKNGGADTLNLSASKQEKLFVDSGDSSLAIKVITQQLSSFIKYDLRIYSWNGQYILTNPYQLSCQENTLPLQNSNPSNIKIINNSLVISGQYLLRYNGIDWIKSEDLKITTPHASSSYWFAYGNDLAIRTVNSISKVQVDCLTYDSSTNSWGSRMQPLPIAERPQRNYNQAWFPKANGGDYFNSGAYLYYRGPSANWSNPEDKSVIWDTSIKSALYEIESEQPPGYIDSHSIVNQAPNFIMYIIPDKTHPDNTKVTILNLLNNIVQSKEVLAGQSYSTKLASGLVAAGKNAFLTYPKGESRDFEHAQTLNLYRYAGDSIQKNIKSFPVQTIRIQDQMGINETIDYVFENETASCDPTGKVIKYFESTMYPGGQNKVSEYGKVVFKYINGLKVNSPINQNVLDGYLLSKTYYNGQGTAILQTTNDWTVFMDRNQNPIGSNPILLPGAYTRLTKVTTVRDGLTTIVSKSFSSYSGKLCKTKSDNYNGKGQLETHIIKTTYGYEQYPELAQLNFLSPIIQQVKKTDDTIIASTVHTWKKWNGKWASWQTYKARTKQAATSGFNFGSEDPPSVLDWLCTVNIISRTTDHGLVQLSRDVNDVEHLSIFDKNERYVVATFNNANPTTANYYGFEDYEKKSDWKTGPGSSILRTGEAHNGQNSLKVSPNSSVAELTLNLNFDPSQSSGKYLFSCWIRTEEQYRNDKGTAFWKFSINGSQIGQNINIKDSDGNWKYLYLPIDLNQYTDTIALTLELFNQKENKYLLIDNLRFSPWICAFNAHVFDALHGLPIASLGSNGETNRKLYDRFQRPLGVVGADDIVEYLESNYFERQGIEPAPNAPNHHLHLVAQSGGSYSPFNTEAATWQKTWKPNNAINWKVSHGQLTYTGSNPGSIQLANSDTSTNYGVYFKVHLESALIHPMSVAIGKAAVRWNPTVGWELLDNGIVKKTIADSSTTKLSEWLIHTVESGLLFYRNGRQIFAYNGYSNPITGALKITTADPVALSDLTVFNQPMVKMEYLDGMTRPVQAQILEGGNIIAVQKIYDSIGRNDIISKKVRYLNTLFGYQTKLANYNRASGIMENCKLTDDYPDDKGYPFSRSRYEASPLKRVVEKGLPGKDFAITQSTASHTTKIAYSVNQNNWTSKLNLPAGEYAMTTTTSPDGLKTYTVEDKGKKKIALHRGPTLSGETTYQTTWYQYDLAGNINYIKQPNGIPIHLSDKQWEHTIQHNYIGKPILQKTVDSGITKFIYDKAGSVRFTQSEEAKKQGVICYTLYDEIGRPTQEGTIVYDFDALNQQDVDDGSFLPANVSPIIVKTYCYDGTPNTVKNKLSDYGGEPFLIGRLSSVSTQLAGDEHAVIETKSYDVRGNVVQKMQKVTAVNDTEYKTGFVYNNLGKIIQITYPSSGNANEHFNLFYRHNYLGQVSGIGTKQDSPEDIAAYIYNAEGKIEKSIFNQENTGKEIISTKNYNAPGWLTNLDYNNLMSQQISYTSGAYNAEGGASGYYNGNIAKIINTFAYPNKPADFSVKYRYDQFSRLLSAENSLAEKWSLGIGNGKETDYDLNDNIQTISRGSNSSDYAYDQNNKVTQVTASKLFQYDDNGNTIQAQTINNGESVAFTYDLFTQMVKSINVEATNDASNLKSLTTLKLQYDSQHRRVLKQLNGETHKLYLYGNTITPLSVITNSDNKQYIYGPEGLAAIRHDGNTRFTLTDHIGSIRLMVGDTGTVEAGYDYLPYGQLFRTTGQANLTNILYAGYELDREIGLYHDGIRLLDATLGRFYSPDPMREYASPYVYVGDNPIMLTDPTGMIHTWGRIGVGIGMAALAIGGIGLTIATGGADIPVLAAIAGGVAGGAIGGVGTAGIMYDYSHKNSQWNSKQFGFAILSGAISGAISGGVSAGASVGFQALVSTASEEALETGTSSWLSSAWLGTSAKTGRAGLNAFSKTTWLFNTVKGGVSSSISSGTNTLASNTLQGHNGFKGVGKSMVSGFVTGSLKGGIVSNIGGAANQKFQIGEKVLAFTLVGKTRRLSTIAVLHGSNNLDH